MRPACRCFSLLAHGQPLVERLEPLAAPAGQEVIVRIRAAGVCHSDIMLQDGFVDTGTGRKLDMARGIGVPRVLGHEIAGEVSELGPDAAGVSVGDPVVVYPWIGCGECTICASGNEHLCGNARALGVNRDGGYAQYVVVPHSRYLVPMGNLSPEQAAPYACSGLTAYAALRKLGSLAPGDSLLIMGAGGVGLSGIRLAREVLGVSPIVADIDPGKFEMAKQAGASLAIDPGQAETLRALMKATGGGVAAAVDFVGTGESFAFAFGALRRGGRMVSVGMIGGATPFTPALLPFKSATLMGSYVGTCNELRELLALAQTGVLPPLPINTQPLSSANQVLDALRAGKVRGRTVLVP